MEEKNGRVKVNIHHGVLGKSTSVYQDVKGGLYELGFAPSPFAVDTPLFLYTIGNLPFAFEGSEEANEIMKEFAEKYIHEHITDVIPLTASATDPYGLFSTEPIRTVDDFKNMKMRANGKSEVEMIKALNAVPVTMSPEDIYEGLQKKSIDAAFYSPIGSVGYKYYEPAPYITRVNASVVMIVPLMNKQFYESLPDDLKKLFDEELNPKLSELLMESYQTELEKSYEVLEQEIGDRGEIITMSEEEINRMKEAGKPAWDTWIEDANQRPRSGIG